MPNPTLHWFRKHKVVPARLSHKENQATLLLWAMGSWPPKAHLQVAGERGRIVSLRVSAPNSVPRSALLLLTLFLRTQKWGRILSLDCGHLGSGTQLRAAWPRVVLTSMLAPDRPDLRTVRGFRLCGCQRREGKAQPQSQELHSMRIPRPVHAIPCCHPVSQAGNREP